MPTFVPEVTAGRQLGIFWLTTKVCGLSVHRKVSKRISKWFRRKPGKSDRVVPLPCTRGPRRVYSINTHGHWRSICNEGVRPVWIRRACNMCLHNTENWFTNRLVCCTHAICSLHLMELWRRRHAIRRGPRPPCYNWQSSGESKPERSSGTPMIEYLYIPHQQKYTRHVLTAYEGRMFVLTGQRKLAAAKCQCKLRPRGSLTSPAAPTFN